MCNLSTSQKKFIRAAMKKNGEITDAQYFKANGSWKKLKELGKPDVHFGHLNDFITYERLKKNFENAILTPENKRIIRNSKEYAISKGTWLKEIYIHALMLCHQADIFDDETMAKTTAIIVRLALKQHELINKRSEPEEGELEEKSWLNNTLRILEIINE